MNCMKMSRRQRKRKDAFSIFRPILFVQLRRLRAFPTKLRYGLSKGSCQRFWRRLLRRAVRKTEGVEPVRVHYPIFLPLADLLWAGVPTMSQTRTQSFNLIPNRRDRLQIICDGESIFPSHVFEAMRRSLDDFGHKALDIIQVGLSPR
jgi:hypothetical protein